MVKELIHFLTAQHQTMIAQLHQFCAINSGTDNQSGLATMAEQLMTVFKPLADELQVHPLPAIEALTMNGEMTMQQCGDALFIRKRPTLKRRVLLCGHMDTVYPPDSPFQTLTYINDNQINGPGVADMKGGLIVILHALAAFEQTAAAAHLGWDVFINSDEEIGSPASSLLLNQIATAHQAGLVYEPAMDELGTMAKNRRGSGKLTLVATGKAAHVGRAFTEGRNAICYLAEALMAIHALNEQRQNITINIGKIAGGSALNVVPDLAVAKLDVRITHPNDEQWVRQRINAIIKRMQKPDYHLSLTGHFGRPVKQVNKATEQLFARLKRIAKDLSLTLDWHDSGGCCDGNNLAQRGIPVIDTLGVRGGNIHSSAEFVLLDSLIERAALSSLLLIDLAQGGLEELVK